MKEIRIATRKSPLALWQAHHVEHTLQELHPKLAVELVPMSTEGDRFLQAPLAAAGGKGLFIKELEQAMLEGRADIAVHSIKDVTVDFPPGLQLTTILERHDPRDVLISNEPTTLATLPKGAVVGTSSLRRQVQIRHQRPDLVLKDLRGNVNTRLAKLDQGDYDAIILAAAGVERLGMNDRITEYLSVETMLPAIGQGAIGIESRSDDEAINALLEPLHHGATAIRIRAERAVSQNLYGGCQLPLAAHAQLKGDQLSMSGLVGSTDGKKLLQTTVEGLAGEAETLGQQIAEGLLAQGAGEILEAVLGNEG